MLNYEECLKEINEIAKKLIEIEKLLGHCINRGSLPYSFERVNEYVEALFKRFCSFKVGDKIELSKAPKIDKDNSPGWRSSKHFLIKGAVGTINDIDYRNNKFVYGIVFDKESWLNLQGKEELTKEERKHIYYFPENFITKFNGDDIYRDFHL